MIRICQTSFYRLFILCVFSFLTSNLALAHSSAKAEEKQIEKAYLGWCAAIGSAKGDPSIVVKYYAPNATLLPTLSTKILRNKDHGMDEYFTQLTSHQNIKCIPEKMDIHFDKHLAINSGLYAFSYTNKDGKQIVIPARFTFVYRKVGDDWLIVTHHSSKMPE